ncbi:hypothetical protein OPV22_015864 [Ensete ventricosum]|uniref:ABC transmembrane type-1 domain-containing protein n=1 Tax=Ensete ventricosum TaxID=4639 RepID=A0AAV8RCU1_ENSVE|nr:hypothetical protein OPV22_015864 [Ensete ventricosum]
MMASVLTASSGSMYLVRSKIITHCSCRTFDHHGLYPSSKCQLRRQPIRHSTMKLQAAGNFAQPNNATSYFKDLANKIWEASPKSLKEFPWEEAKDMVLRQLFFLVKRALMWSFIGLYAISFISDISLAISRDRELLGPVGLFVGVALADYIKESLQEFLKSSIEDGDPNTYLLGIGSFFVFVKFVSLCFKVQGCYLQHHVCNNPVIFISMCKITAKTNKENVGDDNEKDQIVVKSLHCICLYSTKMAQEFLSSVTCS